MDLAEIIVDATQEIFSSMVMLGTTPGISFERKGEPLCESVSGAIELDGKFKGVLSIHLSYQSALAVTGSFLDMEVEEIDADVCDTVGELANMLAGNLKAVLDPSGSEIQLSMPSCMHADEYVMSPLAGSANVTVPFYLDEGDFMVELQLLKDG